MARIDSGNSGGDAFPADERAAHAGAATTTTTSPQGPRATDARTQRPERPIESAAGRVWNYRGSAAGQSGGGGDGSERKPHHGPAQGQLPRVGGQRGAAGDQL